jgi:hypothetical protein
VVAEEDDQVVEPLQPLGAQPVELAVRDEVDLLVAVVEPAQEADLVSAEARRHAPVQVGTGDIDALDRVDRVPRVSPPVSVDVSVVVGLPCVGRKDDGDAVIAEPTRQKNKGSKPHTPVACLEAREVEARGSARQVDVQNPPVATVMRPVEEARLADRDPEQRVVAIAGIQVRHSLGPCLVELQGQAAGIARDDERGTGVRPVALPCEACFDGKDAHDEACGLRSVDE